LVSGIVLVIALIAASGAALFIQALRQKHDLEGLAFSYLKVSHRANELEKNHRILCHSLLDSSAAVEPSTTYLERRLSALEDRIRDLFSNTTAARTGKQRVVLVATR